MDVPLLNLPYERFLALGGTQIEKDAIRTCSRCRQPVQPTRCIHGYVPKPCWCEEEVKAKKAVYEALRVHRIEAMEQARSACYRFLGTVPQEQEKSYRSMTFETFVSHDKQQQDQKQQLEAYAKAPRGNLLLFGDTGTGKTHSAAAICNAQLAQPLTGQEKYIPKVRFFYGPDLFLKLASLRTRQQDTLPLLQELGECTLLVIDDLNHIRVPKEGEYQQEILSDVLNMRALARLPTVITTNLSNVSGYFDAPALSRLKRTLTLLKMTGTDYRTKERIL